MLYYNENSRNTRGFVRLYHKLEETSKSFNGFLYWLNETDYIVRHVDPWYYTEFQQLCMYWVKMLFGERKFFEQYYHDQIRLEIHCNREYMFRTEFNDCSAEELPLCNYSAEELPF